MLDDGGAGVIGIHGVQHQRVGAGLGQARGAAEGAGQFDLAGIGALEDRVGAQHQIVRDHKAARAVLLEFGSDAGQGERVADDILGRSGAVGQHDAFGNQAGQAIAGRVGLAAGAAKVQIHVGLAGRRSELAQPVAIGGQLAGGIIPDEVGNPGVVQEQAIAGQLEGPEAVIAGGEAGQPEAEVVRGKIPQPTRGGGNQQRVALVLVEVDAAGRGQIDGKRIGRGGGVGEQAADGQQIPAAAGRAVEVEVGDAPRVLAAAGPDVRAIDGQVADAVAVGGQRRAAANQDHARAQLHGAIAAQGGVGVQRQAALHEGGPVAQHAEGGGGLAVADRPDAGVGQGGIEHGQGPAIEHEVPAAVDIEVAGHHRAGVELERAAVIDPQGRTAAGAGHTDHGAVVAEHQPTGVGGEVAHAAAAAAAGESQRAGADLAQGAATGDE